MAVNQRRRKLLLWTSFLLLPVSLNYFSPYLIIEGLFRGIIAGAFIVWGLFFLSSLLFGRAACSYVCPYGGLQMSMDKVLQKPLKEVRWLRTFRYGLGLVWVIFIVYPLAVHASHLRMEPLYLTENIISADNAQKLIFYYFIVVVLALAPLFLGKRATCHYICPMSILNIAGTKLKDRFGWRSLRLVADPDSCVSCGKCSKACSMSLDVTGMVRSGDPRHTECILCGECVSACGTGAVSRRFCKGK
ncbi:4Fe-4S binding protein [Gorillibacterium sp. sgz5001074]|uniref:4Fe-4S binding protein n=1 Tax=Gorillibacterium sp. sgz5001074 TaxID=3446695 RepID=UPI003F66E941